MCDIDTMSGGDSSFLRLHFIDAGGWEHPDVKDAYQKAIESKGYDEVLIHNGHKGRAYAMTGHKEYFAETSEAYFGTNDIYPFVRAELREHDPIMFNLLEKLWAGPPRE